MKKSLLFFIILAMMQSAVLVAQPGGQGGKPHQHMKPEDRAAKSAEKISKDLDLSKTDYDKVYQIELERFNAMDKLMQASKDSGNPPDFDSMKKINEARYKKLKDLLGEERFKKIKDAEKDMHPMEPPEQR
jgi:hypothetical protein